MKLLLSFFSFKPNNHLLRLLPNIIISGFRRMIFFCKLRYAPLLVRKVIEESIRIIPYVITSIPFWLSFVSSFIHFGRELVELLRIDDYLCQLVIISRA